MDRADLARALAMVALVALFLAGLALINRRPDAPAMRAPVSAGLPSDLSADLRHCAGVGPSEPEEAHCAAVWEENRRRFFGRPARPITPAVAPAPTAVPMPAQAGSQGAGQ